jgi:hypothetical protein
MVLGMNNSRVAFFGIALILLLGNACKSKKGSQPIAETKGITFNSTALLVNAIESNKNDFSYYSAIGQLDYKDDNLSQELGVQIVMEKGQYLYVNITALLGITVARILATPDSLVILDILHRKAIIADYSYVRKMTGAELHLENLQNLIIGNTLFPNNTAGVQVDSMSQSVQVIQLLVQPILQKTVYTNALKVAASFISDPLKNQELAVRYQDVYTQGSNLFPSSININIRAEKNMESQLELKTFAFEKKKEIQFSVPKSYERIRL